MLPEAVEAVKRALQGGATISQITRGKPVGGGKANRSLIIVQFKVLKRHRLEYPDFDRFVCEAKADSKSVGQQIRFSRARARIQTARVREEANDYHTIRAMFPANFPGRDDAAQNLFVAVYEGSLKREDVRARVKRSERISQAAIRRSFDEVTRFELQGRKVIALGDIAAGECAQHSIEHIAVCHPSRRGYTNEKNAIEIAEAIAALGFKGIEKPG